MRRKNVAELVPVDADDRDVLRDAVPELARREERTDRHLVRRREDRRRLGARAAQQLLRGAEAALDREVRRLEELGAGRDSGIRQCQFETLPPLCRDVEVEFELGTRPDVRDRGVPERDEVRGREACDRDVVDREGRQARVGSADRDDGKVELDEPVGLVACRARSTPR